MENGAHFNVVDPTCQSSSGENNQSPLSSTLEGEGTTAPACARQWRQKATAAPSATVLASFHKEKAPDESEAFSLIIEAEAWLSSLA
jgi:hypothetical protein